MPLIEATKEDNIVLEKISYIHYPIWFKIDKVRALINSGNKVNIMTPAYALKLGQNIYFSNIKAQKINCSIFKMFEIVFASF